MYHTPLEARPAPAATPRALAPIRPAARAVVAVADIVVPPITSGTVLNAGAAQKQTKAAMVKRFRFILR